MTRAKRYVTLTGHKPSEESLRSGRNPFDLGRGARMECYIRTEPDYEIDVAAISAGSTFENAWMPGYLEIEESLDWSAIMARVKKV